MVQKEKMCNIWGGEWSSKKLKCINYGALEVLVGVCYLWPPVSSLYAKLS